MTELDVIGPGGRTLRVTDAGDPNGVAILWHHGTPGSRLPYPPDVAHAAARGIRLISYDRPGYGGSARLEGRNVADCAADVRAIAQALGLRRLGVWGASGGGPHAAACAAMLEGLVGAVGVIASLAPYRAPGLDYFGGMGDLNVTDIKQTVDDPAAARIKADADRLELLGADVDAMLEFMQSLMSPPDLAVFTGELGRHGVDSTKEALAPGADGWWDDGLATLGDWGFGLSQIRTPVLVMHGRQDRFVPFAHGEWLSANIPGAEARLYDDEGHLSLLVKRIDELYDWMLERIA